MNLGPGFAASEVRVVCCNVVRYSLAGICVFVASLALMLSLGVSLGLGAEMLFSVIPFNVACFFALTTVPIRFIPLVIIGAAAGGLGMSIGGLCFAIAQPRAFAQFGELLLIFPALQGSIMGACVGLLVWTTGAFVNLRGTVRYDQMLIRNYLIVVALTGITAVWITISGQ